MRSFIPLKNNVKYLVLLLTFFIGSNSFTTIVNNSITIKDNNNDISKQNNTITSKQNNNGTGILPEWGGNCTAINWENCTKLKTYFSWYKDPSEKDPKKQWKHHKINCTSSTLCLKNGWTVTRCQILCMGKCNKDMMSKYDNYVQKEGQCSS